MVGTSIRPLSDCRPLPARKAKARSAAVQRGRQPRGQSPSSALEPETGWSPAGAPDGELGDERAFTIRRSDVPPWPLASELDSVVALAWATACGLFSTHFTSVSRS